MLQRGNRIDFHQSLLAQSGSIELDYVRKEKVMRAGQKVRLKAASPLKQQLNLPSEALGAVLCSYGLLRATGVTRRRLDVRFGPGLVIWGVPDDQFETVEEDAA
jgi:hypothetical protein